MNGGDNLYTIIMNKQKELIVTEKTYLYQRENLADKIQFLIPPEYNDLSLTDFTAVLKYVDQGNVAHAETLTKDDELYKGKIRYTLPIDTSLTRFAGDISIRITFSKVDMDTKKQYVLHTSEITITISPLSDYYSFVPDESLEFVDQLVGTLEAKIDATEKIAETYDKKKADNITYDDNKIQLTSNGEKIGNSITIVSGDNPGIIDTEFEVVEF